jgi:hypothetical protein
MIILIIRMVYFFTIIQFDSYFFTCKRNSPEANYKVSTSKKNEINTNTNKI